MRISLRLLPCAALPLVMWAHTNGLPIRSTSPNIDGGQTCAQCHTGGQPNTGPGQVILSVNQYQPGTSQTIVITIQKEIAALGFGFQLTARLDSDATQQTGAGYFLPYTPPSQSTPDAQVYCDDARQGPCGPGYGPKVEFVTQTSSAIQTTGVGTRTWRVNWVPPGRNLGNVHFYLAVVAATPPGQSGDRVYLKDYVIGPADCNLTGSPVIFPGTTSVEDAASFQPAISSKGLLSIFGQGFAAPGGPIPGTPATGNGYSVTEADKVNGKWPSTLACVAVEIDGFRVPVYYVTDTQINTQAPDGFPTTGEQASVQVILNPTSAPAKQIKSNIYKVNAFPVKPSLFTFTGTGTGNVAALNATKNYGYLADTSVVASGVSAAPGDIIEIFGTGFGDTDPPYAPGEFAVPPPADLPELTTPITVIVGGKTLADKDILYKGLAFDAPGLYQVNLRVPDVPDGDQPITVRVGGAQSQSGATIPVKH